ncbi:MAG: 3'-5' exonuclease [Verrucomicrobiota bacterium JB022]|nr:3'-5' exonuclease [Verrucomicrobiota bacterium JB022]
MIDPTAIRKAYQQRFDWTWERHLGWENVRFVVLDTESTGLNAQRDSIISIGAVVVFDFEIRLDDAFEVILPVAYNSASVMIHGITREEAAEEGMPEPEALAEFLRYLGDGIIVGHHIAHDIEMLNVACRKHFDFELRNLWVDTMNLTLLLADLGIFEDDESHDYSLDGLCRRFGLKAHDRHTAPGDAFLTAQIFLRLLKAAKRGNLLRLGQLMAEPKREE